MAENYKNAFKCHKCPQSNNSNGCPAWNEVIMSNAQTGSEQIVKGCNFQLLPWIMTEAIKASHLATGTAADYKNEMARGFAVMAQAMPELVTALASTVEDEDNKVDVLPPGDKD